MQYNIITHFAYKYSIYIFNYNYYYILLYCVNFSFEEQKITYNLNILNYLQFYLNTI
jgi:hypothetical protein